VEALKLLNLNGGQGRNRTADASLFRAHSQFYLAEIINKTCQLGSKKPSLSATTARSDLLIYDPSHPKSIDSRFDTEP
jgi:hypothetical protein